MPSDTKDSIKDPKRDDNKSQKAEPSFWVNLVQQARLVLNHQKLEIFGWTRVNAW